MSPVDSATGAASPSGPAPRSSARQQSLFGDTPELHDDFGYRGPVASVYECTSEDEVIDLVRGGQGVFGIAVGRVWQEVEGSLAALPSEPADGSAPTVVGDSASDELASRRAARRIG